MWSIFHENIQCIVHSAWVWTYVYIRHNVNAYRCVNVYCHVWNNASHTTHTILCSSLSFYRRQYANAWFSLISFINSAITDRATKQWRIENALTSYLIYVVYINNLYGKCALVKLILSCHRCSTQNDRMPIIFYF